MSKQKSDKFWKLYDKVLKETGMMISPERSCHISFNKRQRKCKEHTFEITEFGKRCYCSITDKNCNVANCPQLNGEDEIDEACEN